MEQKHRRQVVRSFPLRDNVQNSGFHFQYNVLFSSTQQPRLRCTPQRDGMRLGASKQEGAGPQRIKHESKQNKDAVKVLQVMEG